MWDSSFNRTEAQLEKIKESLENEIHIIAWHYHWSRDEILGLNVRDRKFHLERIIDILEKKKEAGKKTGRTPRRPRRRRR